MGSMSRFSEATQVTEVDNGRYKAELDPGYLIGDALNGGYLMAVMQRAALHQSEHPHAVSSSFHFLRPGLGGPADIEADVLKSGRTVSTVQVLLRQDERPAVAGTIAAAALTETAEAQYARPPVELPAIEECSPFDPRRGASGAGGFVDRVDVRFTPQTIQRLEESEDDPDPELLGYIQPGEGGTTAEELLAFLPVAVDALPPVVMVFDSWRWAPTVELTWHLRALPEAGPLAFRSRADSVRDGWFDENVVLWDSGGRLVAQARQLARVGR
jgi:hypothetical protein